MRFILTCPKCNSAMLQPIADSDYFMCVDCGTFFDIGENVVDEKQIIEEGYLVEVGEDKCKN